MIVQTKLKPLMWIVSMGVVAVVAVIATWAVVGSSTTPAGSTEETPTWLFSEGAASGTFTTNADGTYTLTLVGMDPMVTAFTDRPERDTALVPIAKLFDSWDQLFAESPPNAVLVEHDPVGDVGSYVVTLTDPTLDGTTGTFTATVVQGKDHSDQVPELTPAPNEVPPSTFGAVSLFIDDVDAGDAANKSKFHITKVA